jgi:hypothetical protein
LEIEVVARPGPRKAGEGSLHPSEIKIGERGRRRDGEWWFRSDRRRGDRDRDANQHTPNASTDQTHSLTVKLTAIVE